MEDLLNHANLGLLPDQKSRFGSFGLSLVVNVALTVIAAVLGISHVHQMKKLEQNTTMLVFPVEQPKPEIPPVPKVNVIPPPPKVQLEAPNAM